MRVKLTRSMSDKDDYQRRRKAEIKRRLAELPWNVRLAVLRRFSSPRPFFLHGVYRRAQRVKRFPRLTWHREAGTYWLVR